MLLSNFRQIGRPFFRNPIYLSNIRNKAAYEGEGKTTIRVINQEFDLGLMIDAYSTCGFRLNNGITVLGPIAIFPRAVLSWQVGGSEDITEPSLRFFKLLEPKIDLLVIGLETRDRKNVDAVFKATRDIKLNVEILPTDQAISTFNFLNAESRSVAGAMVPPLKLTLNEDDLMDPNIYKNEILWNN